LSAFSFVLGEQGGLQVMGELTVDGVDGKSVQSVEELVGRFQGELFANIPKWKERLANDPMACSHLEREIQLFFHRGADLVMAGLLAVVMKMVAFDEAHEQTRTAYAVPLAKGRMRKLKLKLLGGLVVWVRSLYCEPKRDRVGRQSIEEAPGLHVELAQFGFVKGCSPGMEELVARRVASCHSFDFAVEELRRGGVEIDYKVARRIAYQCGEGLLTLRKRELEQWRAGKLLVTGEFAGQHVCVQIDGGRIKTRVSLGSKESSGFLRPRV